MPKKLSAEEQKARMTEERSFLTKLFEHAVAGEYEDFAQAVDGYVRQNDSNPLKVITEFKDGQQKTALHFACLSPIDTDILERILNNESWFRNAESLQTVLQLRDKDGLTPLMLAAQHKDPKVAQKRVSTLLSKAGDLQLGSARSQTGAAALHYAAGAGATPETVRALNKSGPAALNSFSNRGGTPLHWACSVHQKDLSYTIKALLECGADVNAAQKEVKNGMPPPIVLACAAGNEKNALQLLENPQTNVNITLPGNVTLLHMAADLNMVETLTALIQKASDKALLEQKNEHGLTPLEWAAQEGHVGCVLLLMAAKKDATVPTEDDAKVFIDEFQRTHAKPATKQQTKNEPTGKKLDPIETEAKRKLTVFVQETEPSAEKVEKALDFKAKGNAPFAKKEWQLAHDFYTEAITENPRDATFYSNRSACRMQLGQEQGALEDAYIARELRPEWSKAFYRIAVALLQLERFEEAACAAFDGLQVDEENDELESLLKKCVKKGRQDYQSKHKKGSP